MLFLDSSYTCCLWWSCNYVNLGIVYTSYYLVPIHYLTTNFILCTVNIRSNLHPLFSATISDFIDSHCPNLFCFIETWIKPSTTFTELAHCTPPNYTLLRFPRTSSNNTSSSAVGGGTGFLIREPFIQLSSSHTEFSCFESSVTLKLSQSKILIFNIYGSPSSSTFFEPFSVYFLMNLILSLLRCYHTSWIHHHWRL